MKKFITLLFIALLIPALKSKADNNKVLIEHVKKELAKANTQKDSVRLLYDLWDLSLRKDQMAIGNQLFDVATRGKMPEVQYDILRQMSNITRSDSVLRNLETKAKSLASTPAQKETVIFIRIKKSANRARTFSEDKRQEKIANIIQKNNFDKLDKYGKIERMFTICEYLSNYADGNLLIKCMGSLENLMDAADLKSYALRNVFYTESANIYTYTGKGDKALEADRKLLEIVDDLEKEYKAKGRRYRNYDVNRYLIYRRMLSNYEWLSTEEANKLYSKILVLADRNADVKKNFSEHQRTKAYHAMKDGRYAEAIVYIKDNLEKENCTLPIRKHLIEMMMEAAKKSGDNATLAKAKELYEPVKQEYDSLHTQSKYNDLRVRYKVNVMKSDIDRMALESKDLEIKSTRRIMTFVIVGWVAFGIILILMLILWTRYKRNTIHLEKFVKALAIERNRLKKESNIVGKAKKTLPTVSLPENRQKRTVDGMLNYVLNDLLYIASIGQQEADQFSESVDVAEFIKDRTDTLNAHLNKALTIEVKNPEPDFEIFVDKECLTRLFDHILRLAVRLTPQGGKVGIECMKDKENNKADFTIWHTGNSLPDGKEEVIFDNFITFDNLTEEKDSALEMCRMIHLLIDTTLHIEKTENLAKLTFSIPMHEG